MFGISLAELLIVLFLAIFIINPKDLPEIARYCGKIYARIKNIITKFKKDFENNKKEIGFDEIKQEFQISALEEENLVKKSKTKEIIDIYGNIHKVQDVEEIRSDLSKEELEEELKKYNEFNKKTQLKKE